MTPAVWTKPEHEAARIMWENGATPTTIGKALGKTRLSVCGYIYRNRDAFPKPVRHRVGNHPKAVEAVAELFADGKTLDDAVSEVNARFGLRFAAPSYYSAMVRKGLHRPAVPGTRSIKPSPVAPEPKTEVVFHDLVIRKCTRIVRCPSVYTYGPVTDVPISLSAGVRVLEVAA